MPTLSLSQWKDVATIFGVIVATGTLGKVLLEYIGQGAQKRAEHFSALRIRLKDNDDFREICAKLDTDDAQLTELPFKSKRDFLGFFEEVALFTYSGLMRKRVAHYMFGYYAIRCWHSTAFWNGINRDSYYWALFREFVKDMEALENDSTFRRRDFRL